VLAAGLVSLAGVIGARVHLARVAGVRRAMGDVRPAVIRALPPEERLSRLARCAGPSGWLASLVEALEREESAGARAALIDEAVRDVEQTIDGGAAWPAAAARVAAFGGLAAGVGAYLAGSFPAALSAGALGVTGAVLTIGLDRRARDSTASCRRAIDDLIDALAAGSAAEEPALAPSRAGRPRIRRRRFS
jgi:hypothetical protein